MGYAAQLCISQSPAGPHLVGFGAILGSDWQGLVFLAILVSALFLAIIYMFSQFLRSPKLTAWSRHEVLQTAVIAVFMLAVLSVVWGMCSFDMTIFSPRYQTPGEYPAIGGSVPSAYAIADSYLSSLEKTGGAVFLALLKVNYWIGLTTKVVYESRPMGIGYTTVPLEGLSQLSNLLFFAMSGFVLSYLVTLVQRLLVEYLLLAVLNFLLPLGILLRAITPTRQFGGGILGLSIALMLFYPIFLVFNDMVMGGTFDKMQQLSAGYLGSGNNAEREGLSSQIFQIIFSGPWGWLARATDFVVDSFLHLMFFVVIYFIGAVVLPAFNFIALIEVTRTLSKMLGEEIDVTNLTRLI